MRHLLIVCLALLMVAGTAAVADPLDDAFDAYDAGNFSDAFARFDSLADQGDGLAMAMVGYMFERGDGVATDDERALAAYRRSADAGDMWGQYYLALFLRNAPGDTIEIDDAGSFRWMMRAAEQGLAAAQSEVGSSYDAGIGVAEDDGEAVAWYRRAAENGDPDGQYLFGLALLRGYGGLAADPVEARKWLESAADQGHERAQSRLEAL